MKQLLLIFLFLTLDPLTDVCCAEAPALLSVKLAIPAQASALNKTEKREIHYPNYKGGFPVHFPVIITNVSDKPQRVMQEWCSDGYFALSFEFTDESGKTQKIKKLGIDWSKNFPAWSTLQPNESLVIDVYYATEGIWEGMPHPPSNQTQKVTMQAIFEMEPFGRLVSKPQEVVFSN